MTDTLFDLPDSPSPRLECPHLLRVDKAGYHPRGTCFRVETITPSDRCALKLTTHAKRRGIDPARWVLSGGSPISICHPCSANCPLNVVADDALMHNRKRGPCPACSRTNQREDYGEVRCKECGTQYNLTKNNLKLWNEE